VSAQAVTGSGAGVGTGELAVVQRVQQLQALIEATRQVAAGGQATTAVTPAGSQAVGGGFASALQAASSTGASTAAYEPAAQSVGAGSESGEYESLVQQAAARNGLDPAVLHGVIQQESGFDPSATSSAGAEGLTQLMPGTASSMGVANPLDPAESIEGGARYLGQLMRQFNGATTDALAAYNAGPGAVQQYGGVPPYAETQSYVTKVLGYAEAFRQSHPSATSTGVLT
jgi:soluble lytic murein transglycosylase-like protein